MLTRLDLRGRSGDLRDALPRADVLADDDAVASVREIIAEVRAGGDAALRDLTERFDGCSIDDVRVSDDELRAALDETAPDVRTALEYARGEIVAYHEAQLGPETTVDRDGVTLRELIVPVERAGCYVPGGRAAYPSTVLMTAVPARIAGVESVVLCVPPADDGRVPSATLAAAALAGVDAVYRVGGAQAIAALAYGTETIQPVDVIAGPGNRYVTLAKREVAGVVGAPLAGPSEVVVVADDSAPPDLVAVDLLAQAEHGPGGAAVLVTWSEQLAAAVDEWVTKLLDDAPRRADIERALRDGGHSVLVDGPDAAMEVANAIAPEHLELMTSDPESLVPLVRNAGAVFCGISSPAVVGDYVAGVNHVLPTGRTARFASALRVDDFRKHVHVVTVDDTALQRITPYIESLARVEGLSEHGRSVTLRQHRP